MFQREVYDKISAELPQYARLISVSKTYPIEDILEAYQYGVRIFGENKVQELVPKYEALPKDIEWHLIGHLQSNKVKYIAPFIYMIHSIDSVKLLSEIQKQALKNNRKINVLLQFHISDEETKFGFDPSTLNELVRDDIWNNIPNVEVCGVMGMASFTENKSQVQAEFKTLKKVFDFLKNNLFSHPGFSEISMGMSGDYPLAIQEGSTMIRVGTALFGKRNYI